MKAATHDLVRPRTLYRKVWDSHVIARRPGEPALLYIDLHLIHEVTSPQAFAELERRGLPVCRPDRTVATADHAVPTAARGLAEDPEGSGQIAQLAMNCEAHGIPHFGPGDERQGIVHVISPELGLTRPGMTIVCGDSHTATHGAFGALAFGIGTSEVAQVLATQCLPQRSSPTLEVRADGRLPAGVSAKDMILALIARVGVAGAAGHVIEYAGEAIRALPMEGRMTVCNMSIEAGARAGMIAPDETTFRYLEGRPFAPRGRDWETAVAEWRKLSSDPGARHDRAVSIDAASLAPMITFGTHPGMAIPVDAPVPDPERAGAEREGLARALRYMDLPPGKPLLEKPVDTVFLGSCTNSRLSDLREAASLLRGRRVHPRVRMLVVPGSRAVARAAEAEGLDRIFRDAGAQWREPGCSMCIAMNGDRLAPGELCVSTSNRNFEGRQGPGGRTLLASPLTAAACAVAGAVADPRRLSP